MVYNGYGSPKTEQELQFGPNITDWPPMIELEENILLKISSIIPDPVTTTDELIPSGDAASYRSNPVRMANFTLSRRDPEYAGSAKRFKDLEDERQRFVKEGKIELSKEMRSVVSFVLSRIKECNEYDDIEEFLKNTGFGSAVYAVRPGDGSAREQAASCQRVLGGLANISAEYATKRYRSNLINWGMLPFAASPELIDMIDREDYILIPNIKSSLMQGNFRIQAQLIGKNMTNIIELTLKRFI